VYDISTRCTLVQALSFAFLCESTGGSALVTEGSTRQLAESEGNFRRMDMGYQLPRLSD
jgi:hypothetical protein